MKTKAVILAILEHVPFFILSLLVIFFSESADAIKEPHVDLKPMTEGVSAMIKSAALPLVSLAALGLGIWRTVSTQTAVPITLSIVAVAAGNWGVAFIEKTWPCTLESLNYLL